MNLLADEGIDKPIVDRLRQDGHMVMYIAEELPGITDEVILALANQQDAILASLFETWQRCCATCNSTLVR